MVLGLPAMACDVLSLRPLRSSTCFRTEVPMLRRLVTQPELRAVNGQARHHGTVGSLYTEDFDRTERSLVEFDRAGAVPNRQHRRDRTSHGRSRAAACAHRTLQPARPPLTPPPSPPHPASLTHPASPAYPTSPTPFGRVNG